jgi:hypothetical protein
MSVLSTSYPPPALASDRVPLSGDQVTLAADYNTTNSMSNTGLVVTLPDVGTYLLYGTFGLHMGGNLTVGDQVLGRFYDTTGNTDVTGNAVLLTAPSGAPFAGTTSLTATYTAPVGNTAVRVEACHTGNGSNYLDASALTGFGFVRLL